MVLQLLSYQVLIGKLDAVLNPFIPITLEALFTMAFGRYSAMFAVLSSRFEPDSSDFSTAVR